MLGHADHVHARLAADVAVAVGKHEQLATPGAHFLHVALELVQQGVVGRTGDRGSGIEGQVLLSRKGFAIAEP